jgi:hypothetical protein
MELTAEQEAKLARSRAELRAAVAASMPPGSISSVLRAIDAARHSVDSYGAQMTGADITLAYRLVMEARAALDGLASAVDRAQAAHVHRDGACLPLAPLDGRPAEREQMPLKPWPT